MGKAKSDENDDTANEDRRGDDADRAKTDDESDSDSGSSFSCVSRWHVILLGDGQYST
jgi:hypothetical protein